MPSVWQIEEQHALISLNNIASRLRSCSSAATSRESR